MWHFHEQILQLFPGDLDKIVSIANRKFPQFIKPHSTEVQILHRDPMCGWIPVLITPIVTFDMANSFKNGFTTSKKYPATLSHSEP